jgi:hypothetical protein
MYTSPTSSGYLIRDTIFFDNGNGILSASGNGIHISDTSGQGNANPGTSPPANVIVRKNKVRNTRSSGIEVTATGAGYQVLDNRSLANTLHGLHFTKDTSGGAVTGNTALDNEDLDCKDESTPLANTWTDNIGGSALPRIICTAPPPSTTTAPATTARPTTRRSSRGTTSTTRR